MNRKQKEGKRKNAQAHQKRVKDLAVQREMALAARGPITDRRVYKADRVIVEMPKSVADPTLDVFGAFFTENFKQGSGVPLTPELEALMKVTAPHLYPTRN